MTTEERIDALTEAQGHLFEAIELIAAAVKGTGAEANVRAYLLAQLQIAASDDHGFLSHSQNILDVMAMVREG